METTKKIKDFDCVEMKNAIQAQIYAEIKDMTSDEILAYFNSTPKRNRLCSDKNFPHPNEDELFISHPGWDVSLGRRP